MVPGSAIDNIKVQITTVKLNGTHYLLWVQAVKVSSGARGKLKFILSDPPKKDVKKNTGNVLMNLLATFLFIYICFPKEILAL